MQISFIAGKFLLSLTKRWVC